MPFYNVQDPAFVPSVDILSDAFGLNALANVSTGTKNEAFGASSLTAVTTGSSNNAHGYQAGASITTGSNNLCLGHQVASTTLTTGSNNIIIGTSSAADAASASTSNSLWIGGGATAVLSATGINATPAVTIPGTLVATGGISGIGTSVGVVSSGFVNTGSTLATITGLAMTLGVGTYVIDGYISCQCAATPGIALKFLQGGVGASALQLDTWIYSAATLTAQSAITALTSNLVSSAVTATSGFFSGTIVVTTAGTLTLQAAQAVSNATILTIANNSYMTANRIV